MSVISLEDLNTPSLLLERKTMRRNLQRMADRVKALGCNLRPHVKTHKSREVLAEAKALSGDFGITVSTLNEARYFAEGGTHDILYAVGMTPQKVSEAAALMTDNVELTAITDNLAMVDLLQDAAASSSIELALLIELDVDGHRSGVDPGSDVLIAIARGIAESANLQLRGVMTHAGGSYECRSVEAIGQRAAEERDRTVAAAQRIRNAGLECPVVSIGSTPTASVVDDLDGVTEIRPGVYTFFDLFQSGLGIATLDDIALSVLTTVIGHQPEKGWVIVDAGWMAMSRDLGTGSQTIDQGYGLVCDVEGRPLGDVIVGRANQEHGILMTRDRKKDLDIERFPVGSRWRVLPNHACATAGQYSNYQVIEDNKVVANWERTRGW